MSNFLTWLRTQLWSFVCCQSNGFQWKNRQSLSQGMNSKEKLLGTWVLVGDHLTFGTATKVVTGHFVASKIIPETGNQVGLLITTRSCAKTAKLIQVLWTREPCIRWEGTDHDLHLFGVRLFCSNSWQASSVYTYPQDIYNQLNQMLHLLTVASCINFWHKNLQWLIHLISISRPTCNTHRTQGPPVDLDAWNHWSTAVNHIKLQRQQKPPVLLCVLYTTDEKTCTPCTCTRR